MATAPGVEVSEDAWLAQTARFIDENRQRWRKDATQPGAERSIAREVADRLEGLGLITRSAGGIRPRAAIGRYALAAPGEVR